MTDRWWPHINWGEPVDEREIKRHVSPQIDQLNFWLGNFRRAVSLMDHCEGIVARPQVARDALPRDAIGSCDRLSRSMHEPWDWMQIAARDAVMTVYHFGITLDALKRNAGKAPTLRNVIDSGRLKNAWKRFEESFPFYEKHRHAVAHLADDMLTIKKLDALAPEDGPLIIGALCGRTYTMNYSDRKMTLDVTSATADELDAIMAEAWEAFRPASVW